MTFRARKVVGTSEKRAPDLHVTETSYRRREKLMKAMLIAFTPFYCFGAAI